jgi:hypothetical protein
MDDLERLRTEVEIEKLRAETANLKRPSHARWLIPAAGVVGALGGIAALLQAIVQIQMIRFDSVDRTYRAEQQFLGAEENANRQSGLANTARLAATKATAQANGAQAALNAANSQLNAIKDEIVALRGQIVSAARQKPAGAQTIAGEERKVVQIFLRSGSSDGATCSATLTALGYTVSGVTEVSSVPHNDEVKYFWPNDAGAAKALAGALPRCGLSVPPFNVVYITGDPSPSPHQYFEVWVGMAR